MVDATNSVVPCRNSLRAGVVSLPCAPVTPFMITLGWEQVARLSILVVFFDAAADRWPSVGAVPADVVFAGSRSRRADRSRRIGHPARYPHLPALPT
jgi:hypothetical protein